MNLIKDNDSRLKILRSLEFKILLLILFIGIIPFSVCVPISMHIYRDTSLRTDGQNLMTQALQYNTDIVTSGYLTGEDNRLLDDTLEVIAENYHGRILVINSSLRIVRDSYGVDVGKTVVWESSG